MTVSLLRSIIIVASNGLKCILAEKGVDASYVGYKMLVCIEATGLKFGFGVLLFWCKPETDSILDAYGSISPSSLEDFPGMFLKLLALALNIIAISDVLRSRRRSIAEKVVLIVLIMAIPYVGAGIYLLALREKD